MSTLLLFTHYGWDVCTASWSAASKDATGTVVCYLWNRERSAWKIKFDIPFADVLDRVSKGGVVDLRSLR